MTNAYQIECESITNVSLVWNGFTSCVSWKWEKIQSRKEEHQSKNVTHKIASKDGWNTMH